MLDRQHVDLEGVCTWRGTRESQEAKGTYELLLCPATGCKHYRCSKPNLEATRLLIMARCQKLRMERRGQGRRMEQLLHSRLRQRLNIYASVYQSSKELQEVTLQRQADIASPCWRRSNSQAATGTLPSESALMLILRRRPCISRSRNPESTDVLIAIRHGGRRMNRQDRYIRQLLGHRPHARLGTVSELGKIQDTTRQR